MTSLRDWSKTASHSYQREGFQKGVNKLTYRMATIKVYPPSQLPDRGVSETQFKIWVEELEVYLSQVDRYEVFLTDGSYSAWESQENNENRLTQVKGEDAA